MKCRDIHMLLPDLIDGTLNAEDKARVDEHCARCEECRMDAALLTETFGALRADVPELPPTHYFSTLLPKVRERLGKKERTHGFLMPAWLEKAAAPLTVFAMGIALVGLFRAFQPAEEFSPLRSLVEQMPGDDIAALVASTPDPLGTVVGVPSSDRLLETAPDPNAVADDMRADLLSGDDAVQQADAGMPADDNAVNELDDDAVSQVLDLMSQQSTL